MSPYEQAFARLQMALIDIDGDGVPDVAPRNLMEMVQANPRGLGNMPPASQQGEIRSTPTNAQGIVDELRRQGIPDQQIAQTLASMMASGAIRGLPVAAGAVMLNDQYTPRNALTEGNY